MRRQFGSDKRAALPPVAPSATSAQIGTSRLAILVTAVGWTLYTVPALYNMALGRLGYSWATAIESLTYLFVVSLLTLSAVAYLITRHGQLLRSRHHRRSPRAMLDSQVRERANDVLTVLIPSYREERNIILQTALSAALQEYPNLHVVLLIDDPPNPTETANIDTLKAARNLPAEVGDLLREPATRFATAAERYLANSKVWRDPVRRAAIEYRAATKHITRLQQLFIRGDHSDEFMRRQVLGSLRSDLESVADALEQARAADQDLPVERLQQLFLRLKWTFECELSSFERKQYANMSHEPNKAMNLNSYLSLLGGNYVDTTDAGRRTLLPATETGEPDLVVPASPYVMTLDADSVLLPEYCLRLTHRMEGPAFTDVAVIQTPYSSYPGSKTRLERIAAATTDVQHILHQGMSHFDATYWVGANAIIRTAALADIAETDDTGEWPITSYIQDRTVIEDTESSVDLVAHGWRLHNYGERLSYSATPPDFGSLCIQRQRWANGGLIILPKLLRTVRKHGTILGNLLRINYIASIAWSTVGLLLLLVWPFDDRLLSPLVVAIVLPYFMAMATDLHRTGYKRTDVVRVYAFNLVMLPVNLFGTVQSVIQGITGRKVAFARTPKVKKRTTAGFTFVAFPYLLLAWSGFTTWQDIEAARYSHATFAGLNAVLTIYGLVAFIGIRNSLVDMTIRAFELIRVDTRTNSVETPDPRWDDVLFYGTDGQGQALEPQIPASVAITNPSNVIPFEERGTAKPRAGTDAVVVDLVSHERSGRSDTAATTNSGVARPDLVDAVRAARDLLDAIERDLELDGHGQTNSTDAKRLADLSIANK